MQAGVPNQLEIFKKPSAALSVVDPHAMLKVVFAKSREVFKKTGAYSAESDQRFRLKVTGESGAK